MIIKYKEYQVPSNYQLKDLTGAGTISPDSENHILLGTAEKKISLTFYALTVFKTFGTLGLWLFSKDLRGDWRTLWQGKKIVKLYCLKDDGSDLIALLKSSDKTDRIAQLNLVQMYLSGIIQVQSSDEFDFLCAAANQGHASAQTKLGLVYANLPKPLYPEAAQWYRKAADQNDPEAQCYLGILYEAGQGVEMSNAKAAKWYKRAGDQNYDDAKLYLEALNENVEDLV